ncbi:MAG: hypothetical protein JYX80_11460 [Candidatus Scalindua sediminis]|nr:hypothetical protein [Candidatus Scalindua sediminis]
MYWGKFTFILRATSGIFWNEKRLYEEKQRLVQYRRCGSRIGNVPRYTDEGIRGGENQSQKEEDDLKKEIIRVEIEEIEHKINSAMYYFEGAVKKIQHNYDCIQQIMDSNNYKTFDEIDFEKEEEEYHIKTAMNQSVRCVRQTGRIDAGNQEYLEQCGINPGIAQANIAGYLIIEGKQMQDGDYDKTTGRLYDFLERFYQEFKGLSKKRLEKLGVKNGFMEDVMYKTSDEDKKTLLY